MGNDTIDKTYGVPLSEISCPGCGRKYGHHNTKVDTISQECESCVKKWKYKTIELMDAKEYISTVLGYQPGAF